MRVSLTSTFLAVLPLHRPLRDLRCGTRFTSFPGWVVIHLRCSNLRDFNDGPCKFCYLRLSIPCFIVSPSVDQEGRQH